jgi:cob(I)alamin adenosyltransferase
LKIYTKSGDSGHTGLIGGARVRKDDPRVAAYGDVDELNALLGVVLAYSADKQLNRLLQRVQRDLFALGAQLADPRARIGTRKAKAALEPTLVRNLEKAIDAREAKMEPLRAFILPGGSALGSFLHLARAVCRRAERSIVTLTREEPMDPVILVYMNRLSDLLFVLARYENFRNGYTEQQW